jgi:hypothetical protein
MTENLSHCPQTSTNPSTRLTRTPFEMAIYDECADFFHSPGKEDEYVREHGLVLDRNRAQAMYLLTLTGWRECNEATLGPAGEFIVKLFYALLSARRCDACRWTRERQNSARQLVQEEFPSAIVMDGTLQDAERSWDHIDAAQRANHVVYIFFVHCPFETAIENNLKRGIADGRLVPLCRAASGHFNSPRNVLAFVDERGFPESRVVVLQNQYPDQPRKRSLAWLREHLSASRYLLMERGSFDLSRPHQNWSARSRRVHRGSA